MKKIKRRKFLKLSGIAIIGLLPSLPKLFNSSKHPTFSIGNDYIFVETFPAYNLWPTDFFEMHFELNPISKHNHNAAIRIDTLEMSGISTKLIEPINPPLFFQPNEHIKISFDYQLQSFASISKVTLSGKIVPSI